MCIRDRMYTDNRLISFMSHPLNELLRIILNSIHNKYENDMGIEQRGSFGTREALFCVSTLLKRSREVRETTPFVFLLCYKTFFFYSVPLITNGNYSVALVVSKYELYLLIACT